MDDERLRMWTQMAGYPMQIKQEPINNMLEEVTDDSGVSPGHYNSSDYNYNTSTCGSRPPSIPINQDCASNASSSSSDGNSRSASRSPSSGTSSMAGSPCTVTSGAYERSQRQQDEQQRRYDTSTGLNNDGFYRTNDGSFSLSRSNDWLMQQQQQDQQQEQTELKQLLQQKFDVGMRGALKRGTDEIVDKSAKKKSQKKRKVIEEEAPVDALNDDRFVEQTSFECPLPTCKQVVDTKEIFVSHLLTHNTSLSTVETLLVQQNTWIKIYEAGKKKKPKKGATDEENNAIDSATLSGRFDNFCLTRTEVHPSRVDALTPKISPKFEVAVTKCKHCKMVFVTKAAYWRHLEQDHLDPKKILRCEFCHFVTNLAHHYSYHMLNHGNKKQYTCDKCDYVCVNKSMLTSHAKMHSEKPLYYCADCDYSTKYAHALKDHMKTKGHRQGEIYNTDGTLDTDTIIDIHSKKRGPRHRSKNSMSSSLSSSCTKQADASPAVAASAASIFNGDTNTTAMMYNPTVPMLSPSLQQVINANLAYSHDYTNNFRQILENYVLSQVSANLGVPSSYVYGNQDCPISKTTTKTSSEEKHPSVIGSSDGPLDLTTVNDEIQENSAADIVTMTKNNNNNNNNNNDDDDDCALNLSRSTPTKKRKGTPVKQRASITAEKPFITGQNCPYQQWGCQMTCNKKEMLRMHFNCHDVQNPLMCAKCSMEFRDFEEFNNHLMMRGLEH